LTSSKPSKCTHSAHSHLNKWEAITVDDGNLSLVNKHQHWPWSNASYATLTLLLKRFASGSFLRVTLPSVYINRSIVMSLFSCSKRMMSSSFSTMTLSLVVPARTDHAWDSGDCYWLCIHLRTNHVCHGCRFADVTHVARLQETAIGLKDTRVQSWRLAQKTYTAVRCSVAWNKHRTVQSGKSGKVSLPCKSIQDRHALIQISLQIWAGCRHAGKLYALCHMLLQLMCRDVVQQCMHDNTIGRII